MGRLAAAVLLLAACKGKEAAPQPVAGSAPATALEVAAPPIDAAPDRYRALVMPEVTSGIRPDAVTDAPIAVIAILQVSFEGAPVVRVMGGKIDPKAIDDRRVIAALSELYAAYARATMPPPALVNLAVVPQLEVGVALDVMTSIAASGQRRFALLVRTPEGTGALPLSLHDERAELDALELVITDEGMTVVRDGRTLFTGPPGPDPWPALRAKLVELGAAQRGAPLRVRIAESRPIVALTAALIALRADDAGQPLFRDVALARWTPPPSEPSARMDDDEAARFADLLTADVGVLSDDMSRRAPGSDLGAQIEDVRESGAYVAMGGGDSLRGTRSDPDPRVATGAGPTVTDADGGTAPGPTGRITLSDKQSFDESSLTADAVVRKVQSVYIHGLRRCYQQALEATPDLAGKLRVELTVDETGRVISPRVTADDRGQQQCVEAQARSWRFAIPEDQDGEATEASFALTFQLSPG